jgi:hypothetical protein
MESVRPLLVRVAVGLPGYPDLSPLDFLTDLVLSNHGGRQLEFSRPPIDVLQEIRRMHPEVLDSGMQIFVVSTKP